MKVAFPSPAHAAESVRVAKERLRVFARESDASRPKFHSIVVRVGIVAAASVVATSAITRLLPISRPSGSRSPRATSHNSTGRGLGLLGGALWPILLRSAQVAAPFVISAISRSRRTTQGVSRA